MSTGMVLFAVFCAENVDSAGEQMVVSGAEISTFEEGLGLVNYEHKDEKNSNGEEIVGKILSAKKIYSKSDCSNKQEEEAWDAIKSPMIVGWIRLFDGAGHSGAMALAAAIRDQVANNEKILLRWSIEGSTLTRVGNRLTETICRRLSATWKPCNRVCDTALIEDPGAPPGFKTKHAKESVKDLLDFEDSNKSEQQDPMYSILGSFEYEYNPIVSEESLAKATIAGSTAAAPSTLTGGAALQREEFIKKPFSKYMDLMEKYDAPEFDKSEFRTYAKMQMPEASSEFLDHFANIAEDYHVVKGKNIKKHVTSFNLDALDLQLRKAAEEKTEKPSPPVETPEVYKMSVAMDGTHRQTGRFMIANDQLHHLENYHGIMENMLPEGNFDGKTIDTINKLRNSPYVSIERDSVPLTPKTVAPNYTPTLPTAKIPAHRPSVFQYHRVGMDKPHLLEIIDGHHFLDGNKLSYQEMATVMQNIKNGAASLRYKKSKYSDQIQKMEQVLEDLMKNEGDMDPDSALQHVRAAVAAGHMHPDVERALTQHIMGDPMIPGVGNKYAYQQHRAKNKPGVWVGMDGNDFRSVNALPGGHDTGDEAIRSMGGALKNAAAKVPGVKLFRNGGDEFSLHAPSHEHALQFMAHANEHLNNVPPVQGTHKLSMSFGLGNDFQTADKALYHAKEQKVHPATGLRMHPVGQTPNLAHSLIPGHEGPIPAHNLGAEAIHTHIPKAAEAPMPMAPAVQHQPKTIAA